jgi:hypothetical protein
MTSKGRLVSAVRIPFPVNLDSGRLLNHLRLLLHPDVRTALSLQQTRDDRFRRACLS